MFKDFDIGLFIGTIVFILVVVFLVYGISGIIYVCCNSDAPVVVSEIVYSDDSFALHCERIFDSNFWEPLESYIEVDIPNEIIRYFYPGQEFSSFDELYNLRDELMIDYYS